MIVLIGLALYAAAGVAIGIAFVAFGVTRVLPEPMPVTIGARIAVFRDSAQIGALSNLHQNGPIGEGRIIDGCVTLSLARLPVPAGGRLLTAAVHGETRHLPRAPQPRRGRGRPAPAAAGHAGGDQACVRWAAVSRF
jgi:hypothetical protein